MKELRKKIDVLLKELFAADLSVRDHYPISGGSIHKACGLILSDGSQLFLKYNSASCLPMFETEAFALKCLAQTGTIRIPQVYKVGQYTDIDRSYILMELLEKKRPEPEDYRLFGRQLAQLHLADTSTVIDKGNYGFPMDNFIGSTPQYNEISASWISFYKTRRLLPQFKWADRYFTPEDKNHIEVFLEKVNDLLIEPKFPSLLHGDLWEGNSIITTSGEPCLIDPGAYIGHYETDLAMMELFGGFSPELFASYHEIIPEEPGYPIRRDLYQFYHLINHLNLFGERFLPATLDIIYRYS